MGIKMKREPLTNLQIIEYLKRTKEDTTIEAHRMVLDEAVTRHSALKSEA